MSADTKSDLLKAIEAYARAQADFIAGKNKVVDYELAFKAVEEALVKHEQTLGAAEGKAG